MSARYGMIDINEDDGEVASIRGLVEKPAPAESPSTLSIVGRYVLQPEVLQALDRWETGRGGEIQLTDAVARMVGQQPVHGMRFEGRRFDCGVKSEYVAANVAYALARPELGTDVRAIVTEILENGDLTEMAASPLAAVS